MYGHNKSPYIKNFTYINCLKNKFYQSTKEDSCSGYFDIRLECISDLYIGSGLTGGIDNFFYECVKYDKKPFIPGSSLKGAVRNIAEIVSYNCCNVDKYDKENKCTIDNHCIICDSFGMMGFASKVIFGNLMPENFTVNIRSLNKQYQPKENKGSFKEYKSHVNTYKANEQIRVEVVEKGSVFCGRLYFKKLTHIQLSLLLFSFGIDETICLRLGGYKNDGLGVVRVTVTDFIVNGDKADAKAEAEKYYHDSDNSIKNNIDELRKVLMP